MAISTVDNTLRLRGLKQQIASPGITRILEVHSPIAAIIAEHAGESLPNGGFHAFWSSSLTDSALRGLPDTELLGIRARLDWVNSVFNVTTLPLIMDGDTGGQAEHFGHMVRAMEREGVSAVVIEDKGGAKRNSLLENSAVHQLADASEFAYKISHGKQQQRSTDFMVIARLEGLILGIGVEETCDRGRTFVRAGADGLVIHGKDKNPKHLLATAAALRNEFPQLPIIAIPSAYSHITEHELEMAGFNVVIYANHMLRSSVAAMEEAAHRILEAHRALEAEELCIPVPSLLSMAEDDYPLVRRGGSK